MERTYRQPWRVYFRSKQWIRPELAATLVDSSPADFYSIFVDDEVLEKMAEQMNIYATQILLMDKEIAEHSRWAPTS